MDHEKQDQQHTTEFVSIAQTTSMFNVSLLNLPIEVRYVIFDYIDTPTLVRSVRYVCKGLYECVKNYKRFTLDCSSSSKFEIEMVSHIIHPANIVSLIISNDLNGSCSFNEFVSIFDIDQFTGLRSLTLRKINNLERFLPLLDNNNNHLCSLSIEFCRKPCDRSLEILSNIITSGNLKYLDLNNIDNVIERITWPFQCRLMHLLIGTCTYREYELVLCQSPYLKTFSLQNCIMNYGSETLTSASFSSKLLSLSIHHCTLSIEDLYSIFSLTPALIYLKVISFTSSFNSLFDGSSWEQFITSKLTHLNQFEFLFSFDKTYHTPDLESIIATFQAPFWLEDKHWFVTCDYLLERQENLRIYTTPICTDDSEHSRRFEVSSRNGVFHIIERSSAVAIDAVEAKKIIKLDFSGVTLDKLGLKYLANVLTHNQTTIHILNLGDQEIVTKDVEILANALKNNQTLSILYLGENRINQNRVKYLADALQTNKGLIELSLGYNKIGENDAKYIADALKINKTLTTLSLVGNHIGVLGAQHLAEVLQTNNTLIALYLDGNQIEDVGTQHLAHALQTNRRLATLSLAGNQIGIPGAQHLADALRVNTSLTTLSLIGNQMGMIGAKSLADALQNNKSLTSLAIQFNQVSDQMIRHINELLEQNAQFKMEN